MCRLWVFSSSPSCVQLCWSAHGNELRAHSTVRLEPHAGHGTTGLPEQALFRFFSSPDSDQPVNKYSNNSSSSFSRRTFQEPTLRTVPPPPCSSSSLSHFGVTNDGCDSTTRDSGRSGGGGRLRAAPGSPRELGGDSRVAGKKLPVRAVAAAELREDGSTVLVCLVSDHGVSSEVRVVFLFRYSFCFRETGVRRFFVHCLKTVLLVSLFVLCRAWG